MNASPPTCLGPAAAVAEPGAGSNFGRRGRSGIAHGPLLAVQGGGVGAAEKATTRARQARTPSTTVRVGAAGDRRQLRASRTGQSMCTRTRRAGSRCFAMYNVCTSLHKSLVGQDSARLNPTLLRASGPRFPRRAKTKGIGV